ncbi:Protein PIR [Vitis vinifera]|uniref:Protein PIR n=1 Tax=Vitis vinifera TaxID=29760 RepID=A0A438EIU5_VITVI|nr:Protein PIR [Vitis vinifera]
MCFLTKSNLKGRLAILDYRNRHPMVEASSATFILSSYNQFVCDSQIWMEMRNDFLPNFILCNTTQRFVRSSKVPSVPVQRPSVPSAKPNFYCGTQAIIHSGQISLAISQSDHLSLWPSLIPVISPYSQSQGRKRFPVGLIVVDTFPANFPGELPATVFFSSQGAPRGDLQFVPKHRNQKPIHARFSGRRLHLTRRRVRRVIHFPATRFLLQARLTPTNHPSYLFLPSEPCTCLFGVILLPWALRSVFPASSGYFFSTPIPARALGSVLLPFPSMTKYGMASSQVSSVTSPESGGRSEIPNLVAMIPLLFSSQDTIK